MNLFRHPFHSAALGLFGAALTLFASTAFSSDDALRVEGAPVLSTKAEAVVSWRAPNVGNATAVAFMPLPAAALKSLQEENAPDANGRRTKALKIGVARNADTEINGDAPALNWQSNGDGHVARWAITSPDAKAVRVGLRIRALPDSAELRFSGSAAPDRIIGVVSGQEIKALLDDSHVYWTPMTEGETQNIEIYLPSSVNPSDVKIRLSGASHLFTSALEGFNTTAVTKALSESCEVDVACKFSSLGTAFQNTSKAVARMSYMKNGASYLCTGTLLNDKANSQKPYFWTAAHCISTQTVASTLNTYWFYEFSGCSQGSANYRQLSGGAQLLYTNTSKDTTFLLLNNSAPDGAYLAGWDASSRFSSGALIGIHHPAGDYKKVSIGNGPGRTCDSVFQPSPPLDDSSLTVVSWTEGTTEGGSSGSGLFTLSNGSYYLRGGLQGGAADCSNSGRSINNGNADCYSSIALVYDSIKQWLDPAITPPPANNYGPTRDYTGQWVKLNSSNAIDENAWGLTVLVNIPRAPRYLFATWYTYDSNGKAAWYVFQGDSWSANDVITLDVYRYTGSPWGVFPYNNNLVNPTKAGTATFRFSSATAGTFTYNVDNSSRTISIGKLQ